MTEPAEGEVGIGKEENEETMDMEMSEPVCWTSGDLLEHLQVFIDWIETLVIDAGTKEVVERIALKIQQIQPWKHGQYVKQAAEIKSHGPSLLQRCNDVADSSISPPEDHPYWGIGKLMHGLALRKGQDRVYDPKYLHEKRNASVFGHNSATPGRWFPYVICATWNGVHGITQAGVHFSGDGVLSVLVSQDRNQIMEDGVLKYSVAETVVDWQNNYAKKNNAELSLLLKECGLPYSGTKPNLVKRLEEYDARVGKKARSTDPTEDLTTPKLAILRNQEKAARKSCLNKTPVRVVRGVGGGDDTLLTGYRYDGLYKVTKVQKEDEPGIGRGKKVWAYLQRLAEKDEGHPHFQRSLKECRLVVPGDQQEKWMKEIKKGY